MSPTKEQRQERLKQILADQKRRLWNEVRDDIFRNTGEALGTQFDIPQDPGDQSTLDLLEDLQLSVADIRRQQLTQLDAALAKLEGGTYGTCENCGVEIKEERLKIMPFATLCVDCQRDSESPEYPPHAKY